MTSRRIINTIVLLIIIVLLIFLVSLFIERTSNIEGNVANAIFKAITSPQSTGEIEYNNKIYSFVLPAYTYELNNKGNYISYLTIVSMNSNTAFKKINNYYNNLLPLSGWSLVEQIGSGYVFTKDKINLLSTRYRLMTGIEVITFTINK